MLTVRRTLVKNIKDMLFVFYTRAKHTEIMGSDVHVLLIRFHCVSIMDIGSPRVMILQLCSCVEYMVRFKSEKVLVSIHSLK